LFGSGAPPSPEALRGAQARLMRDPSLQFSFQTVPKPPPPTHLPHWLQVVLKFLGQVLGVFGDALGWIFIGGLVLALGIVLFFVGREFARTRWPGLFKRKATATPEPAPWRPDAAAARALLEDADRLAASGAYAAAVRLILHRSIEEIEGRRPRLVRPALTSREIGRLPELPDNARTTFMSIAEVVERSLFGGRDVDAAGFAACRRTYEAFALPGAWA
jgi:hypothetical protein